MFDNSITMNIDGTDRALVRVNQDKFSSQYRYRSEGLSADLAVRHTSRVEKGNQVATDRHNVEITVQTYTTEGSPIVRKAYVVFENPANMAPGVLEDPVLALSTTFLTSTMLARLAAWES